MPRLRRGGRRERARRAGRPSARRLRGGARRSRLRPPHPRAPTLRACGPSSGERRRRRRRRRHLEDGAKVSDLGKDAAPSGIPTRAARETSKPSQVTFSPTLSFPAGPRIHSLTLAGSGGKSDPGEVLDPRVGTQRGEVSWNMGEISGASFAPGGQLGWEASLPPEDGVGALGPSWCLILEPGDIYNLSSTASPVQGNAA